MSRPEGSGASSHDVFSLLEKIERRPSVYIGFDNDQPRQRLRSLELILTGYSMALSMHAIREPGLKFNSEFGAFLRSRFGWSPSTGPVEAILRSAENDEEAWKAFWRLVAEFRTTSDSPPR